MVEQEADGNEYLTPLTQSKKEELLRLESAGKTPRRVKVYLLKGEDWIDNGTGFCIGEIDKDTKVPYFLVRKESKKDEVILKSNLEGNIQYQRQQDTLIVWTDPSGSDLALSFQETEGCADLCDFIIKVQQGNYSPNISLYYVISRLPEGDDITELVTGPVRYPPALPNEENLESVLESLNQCANSQFTRTSILDYLVECKYFDKLKRIFEDAESSGNSTALQHLSGIAKMLLSYNEPSLLEDILSSENNIYILAGILEYDSSSTGAKPGHRALFENRLFKTVIPIDELDIFKRDHSLTVLKEIVLIRYLDGQAISQLNSMIYANQIKVLEYLASNGVLKKLFDIYENKESIELKRDGVRMLHQYVKTAKSIQKHDFFALLVKPGLFAMVNFALGDSEDQVRIMGTELIVSIIEQNVALTNSEDHEPAIDNSEPPLRSCQDETNSSRPIGDENGSKKEIKENKSGLCSFNGKFLSALGDIIANEEHVGMKYQAFEALKTLLDPNVLTNIESSFLEEVANTLQARAISMKQNGNKHGEDNSYEANMSYQLKYFYTKVTPKLFAKIIAIGNSVEAIDAISRTDSTLFLLLCELIIFGTREHDIELIKNFVVEHDILNGMVKLLSFPCKKVLKLHVVRCLRSIVLLNDDNLTTYMLEHDILKALFLYFESVTNQDDMCNSACLDFLNIIQTQSDAKNFGKRRNFKSIAEYLSKCHGAILQSVSCMKIGQSIAALVDNNFNETETTTLGICGETNLEQLGIHESFIRNGFSCHEDIEELNLESIRHKPRGSGDRLLKISSSRIGNFKVESDAKIDANKEYDSHSPDHGDSNIGDKRPRDLHQPIDATIKNMTKRRSVVDHEEENSFNENDAAQVSVSHMHNLSSKDVSKSESPANKKEFETMQGTLVEASGRGGHDS